jgi:energy-coupling factor transporter ATP-binding protein EcfA2
MAAVSAMTLKNIQFIFPNVELRLNIGTKEGAGINIHLLVSPDDPKHVAEVSRFLSRLSFDYARDRYHCTRDDLISLGQHHDTTVSDKEAAYRVGVNQFKVDFKQLCDEYQASAWVQANCLVAVAARSADGTSGLQMDDASFAAQRKEIEAFAHIIFSGSPKQASFWLGQGTLSEAEIIRQYRSLKPCLHGSDAHSLATVAQPDKDRRCWIKGDASFDTLKQACIEPAARVSVGRDAPDATSPNRALVRVSTDEAHWLVDKGVILKPGLVAVIGERGSGKTALADLLAHGADSPVPLGNRDSFLSRAKDHLRNAKVSLSWSSGETTTRLLVDTPDDPVDADVHYLSQQFVEQLCSPEGAQDELIEEIKKVVFAAQEPADRLGTTSFDELLEQLTGDMHQRRRYLRGRLDNMSSDVLAERHRKGALPAKEAQRKQLAELLATDIATRDKIVKSGRQARTEYYGRLRAAIDERNQAIQAIERRRQALEHLRTEVRRFESRVFPDIVSDLRQRFDAAGLADTEWRHFEVGFKGDVATVLATKQTGLDGELRRAREGVSKETPTQTSTEEQLRLMAWESLSEAFLKVTKEIGVDRDNERKLKQLNERVASRQIELKKLDDEISLCRGADERLTKLFAERSQCYEEFFEILVIEEKALRRLYGPLEEVLKSGSGAVKKLELAVVRKVNLEQWADQGEELLDLRKNGKFRGHGALEEEARKRLLPAWQSGSARDVANSMAQFRNDFDEAFRVQSKVDRNSLDYSQWTIDVGRWLYSTSHIQISYSFEYDGLPLSQLSPGTRGIVLLLLYLALDLEDHRPLIIDQPEENLDPRSVFSELVELFRSARLRRQVIVITHNANLVVNTDVDQVIVASAKRRRAGIPPQITYTAGGLENVAIRTSVCEILEGGEAAFRERARRLRVYSK